MTTVAVVPLNQRAEAKSRLRAMLTDEDREALARWMSRRVLAALGEVRAIARIAVVSPDAGVLAAAVAAGATPLRQWDSGLNAGLELGRRWALSFGADSLLIVLGDLPLLTSAEVRALLAAGRAAAGRTRIVLAPDRDGQGTNALLLRPPDALPFAFGADSLARHRALAHARDIEPTLFRASGTQFDVDLPADLAELRRRALWRPRRARCGEALEALGDPMGEAIGGDAR